MRPPGFSASFPREPLYSVPSRPSLTHILFFTRKIPRIAFRNFTGLRTVTSPIVQKMNSLKIRHQLKTWSLNLKLIHNPPQLRLLTALAVLLLGQTGLLASTLALEGQNRGDTNTWVAGNLQNWRELDF